MKIVTIGILVASVVFAGSVYADAYIGGGMGRSDVDVSDGGISFDDTDTGWKIFAGYKFNEYYSVEGAWVDIGDFDDNQYVSLFGMVVPVSLEIDGFAVSGIGSYPIGDSAAVFGRLGVWSWNSDASVFGFSSSEDGTDVIFGLGGIYNFTDALGVRAEWERYKAGGDDADLISISGVFSF